MGLPMISHFLWVSFRRPKQGNQQRRQERRARTRCQTTATDSWRTDEPRVGGTADLPMEVEGVAAEGRAAAAHVGYIVNFVTPMLKTIYKVVNEKLYST